MNKPCIKAYFKSEKQAQQRANEINREPTKRDSVKELYVYKCPSCTGWHLTKKYHKADSEQELISDLLREVAILKQELDLAGKAAYKKKEQYRIKDELLNDFLFRYGLKDIFNAIVEVSLEFNDLE
jgi:excinuclease UvrABC ATPase subunit